MVVQRSPEDAAASLREALDEGLLLALDGGGLRADVHAGMRFRFLHDRVQQAAYSVIPEAERPALHLSIGRLLLERTPPEALEVRLFDVVNQLDMGLSLIDGGEERYAVARLNLAAGRKAKASAAHEPALHYLTAGLSILPERAWEEEGELAFALHCEAMEAEYLNAHLERAEALSERLLARATRVLDKVKVYETRISFNTTTSEIQSAIENGYQAMSLLGVDLPRQIDLPAFLAILADTRRVIGDRGAGSLVALPAMTDPSWLSATRIAALLITPVYFVDALLSFSIVLRILALSLPHGRAPESAFLFAEYALIHAAILDDFDTGEAYGRLARTLADSNAQEGMRARVYAMNALFLVHCKAHVKESFPLSVEAVRAGLESGDLEYMGYGAINHCISGLLSGEQLEVCVREHARYLDLINRYRLGIVATWIGTVSQTARNLCGGAADPTRLVGEAFDEERLLPTLVAAANNTSLSLFYICKTMLGVLFRDTEAALAAAKAAETYVQAQAGQFSIVSFTFFQALALLAQVAPMGDASGVAKATANLEKLRLWAASAPMNVLHKVRLVEAELSRVRGEDLAALRLYGEAIQGAAEHRWVHEEALAHELSGELLLARGLPRQARASLLEARHAYERWGAAAKVQDLDRRYPRFFARAATTQAASIRLSASGGDTGTLLDLEAVLRAAQAMSGEIILDRLLDKLMALAIENAGAQRGLFILPRDDDGSLEITGERTAAGGGGARAPVPVGGDELASSAILHYAARTGESVVLANAAAEGRFTAEPYVLRRRSRSILAAPLVNQGRLVAILYLENELVAGAFTSDRLEVLRLLSAQAALSIHNAVLYARLEEHSRTLEEKVEARTHELLDKNEELSRTLRQLEATREQLVMREKLASLGALTAGIAHELKNPLNFVNNFAQLGAEVAREIAALVGEHRARLDEDFAAPLGDLVTSLQEGAGKNRGARPARRPDHRRDGAARPRLLRGARAHRPERARGRERGARPPGDALQRPGAAARRRVPLRREPRARGAGRPGDGPGDHQPGEQRLLRRPRAAARRRSELRAPDRGAHRGPRRPGRGARPRQRHRRPRLDPGPGVQPVLHHQTAGRGRGPRALDQPRHRGQGPPGRAPRRVRGGGSHRGVHPPPQARVASRRPSRATAIDRVDVEHARRMLQEAPLALGVVHGVPADAVQRLVLPARGDEPVDGFPRQSADGHVEQQERGMLAQEALERRHVHREPVPLLAQVARAEVRPEIQAAELGTVSKERAREPREVRRLEPDRAEIRAAPALRERRSRGGPRARRALGCRDD